MDMPCPNIANHTPHPEWYVNYMIRADEMIKTHKQIRCKDCNLYKIWIKREVSLNERRRKSFTTSK